MADIARHANVSKSTVSLVLGNGPNHFPISEATRKRVQEAAQLLGYRPNGAARALVTGKSDCILLVVFGGWDNNLLDRLRGMESYLVPHGYSTRLCTVGEDHDLDAFNDIIQTGQADGVLITGSYSRESYHLIVRMHELTSSLDIPIIAMANLFPAQCVDSVIDIDDEKGAEAAVNHLIEHGHRRIALISVADQPWALKREKGYLKALQNAYIPIDQDLMLITEQSQKAAYEGTLQLAARTSFSALFAVLDPMAVAAMAALRSIGREIPLDCAVIGFDDNEMLSSYTSPSLTSVANPFYQTGRLAAERVCAFGKEELLEPVEPLPTRLVIRNSCGCKSS